MSKTNNNVKTGVYTRNDEDFMFEFYTSLSARQKMEFVNSVTSMIVKDNYNYIIKDLVFDFYIIDIMTDVDTSEISKENFSDINEMEQLVKETNIVEIVEALADEGVVDELRKAVDFNIEYKTGVHRNPISESLSSLLDTIEKKVDSFDVEGIADMAQAMSCISGELTAEKMLDAYANSPVMKERYRELLVNTVA